MVRERVKAERRARGCHVREVRRRLDDLHRVVRVDVDEVLVRDRAGRVTEPRQEREDLVPSEATSPVERIADRLRRGSAAKLGGEVLDDAAEARELSSEHPESCGLDLARGLAVVPEIPEGSRVPTGPSELRTRAPQGVKDLVERALGPEPAEIEEGPVSGEARPEVAHGVLRGRPPRLPRDDVQDLPEALAREYDEGAHP